MKGVPFQGNSGLTAEAYLFSHLKLREKLFIAFALIGALFFGCASAHQNTTGRDVLSMCGGFYTKKALASEKASIAIDEVDRFLNSCRTAATNEVCSNYACLITQSTEARIQRDLDAQPGTTPGTTFKARPRKPSQDPVNPSLTSLGRLRRNDWPRFLPRPAWVQWVVRRKAS